MSKKIIQSIVILLGIFIIFAFLAVIYGMYLKISTSGLKLSKSPEFFSSNLLNSEKIYNIEVIDKEYLLILIDKSTGIKGAIYDIKKNEIIRYIDR